MRNLPFWGYGITKAPIGQQGKAVILSDLDVSIFIDDRGDIRNECSRTGCITIAANGETDLYWVRELRYSFTELVGFRAQPLRGEQPIQLFKPPPGRHGFGRGGHLQLSQHPRNSLKLSDSGSPDGNKNRIIDPTLTA